MTIGQTARNAANASINAIKAVGLSLALLAVPATAWAAPAAAPAASEAAAAASADASAADAKPAAAAPVAAAPAPEPVKIDPNDPHFKVAPGGYTPMKPVEGVGMPVPGGINIQPQFSPNGKQALAMHDGLVWVMAIITVFVLGLLLFVILRFNKRANPVPSKTSHNTLLEVVWTGIPILILVAIAVPSVNLLRAEFRDPGKDALTVKATGNQWYWTYTYPDNGGFEVISNMLKDKADVKEGERFRTDDDGPSQLAVDNRMVVPAGEDIRLQAVGADVIHAFAVPALWFKLDAVPGRLNQLVIHIDKPGVYFGQCSELCGARHGYMPIVIEALPRDKFNAWVIAQGGKIDGAPDAPEAAAAAPATDKAASAAKPAA
ncbi:cytochrome c oxidase subunit II [Novosphingobium sp.]|uniref:cytochrome c oxidase subunit II n=1 Tax=Novosphingobium sp. TaxID=1874826 RepID=UPI0025E3F629|nr:cytochrome c oxidase subunit II [Novosphingobium sp.]MCC6924503.1 cytochrome c oxidase subunit II [Novosphingobium sp.]